MSTQNTRQPSIQRLFLQLVTNQTLQHAYIFEGKAGTGKKEMALWVTQTLYCKESDEGACLNCQTCSRIASHQHPDVVELAPDGQSIKIGQIRGLKEEFTKSGMESRRKIVIVEDVEKMTNQAANSLLKFLEEPEGEIIVFLLTTARQTLLPTIVSRCQIIQFPQLSKEERLSALMDRGISSEKAAILIHLTNDASTAEEMAERDELTQLIKTAWKWFAYIAKGDDQSFVYVQTDIMPLTKEKSDQYLFLDLILVILQDILNSQGSDEYAVGFQQQASAIRQEADRLRPITIAGWMESILMAKRYLDSNVAAQGIYEDCALQMISLLKEHR
ncbi:DNA polymerase III subunit delta' [Alkalibacterium sp.]|nr:MAG: DNA polymerase III subunit delta' [Alkalibacterium sp.]